METLKGRINEVMGIYAVPEEEVLQEDDDLEIQLVEHGAEETALAVAGSGVQVSELLDVENTMAGLAICDEENLNLDLLSSVDADAEEPVPFLPDDSSEAALHSDDHSDSVQAGWNRVAGYAGAYATSETSEEAASSSGKSSHGWNKIKIPKEWRLDF